MNDLCETACGATRHHTLTVSVVVTAINNTQAEARASAVVVFVLKLLHLCFTLFFTGDILC